jgi:coxsackievirus/adenovirus receptor
VDKALDDVNSVLRELSVLVDVDSETLNVLSTKLDLAEKDLIKAKLDEKLATINNARISQAQLIKTYEDDIDALTTDVNNIEAIRRALPSGCWKKTNIEELR